MASCSSAIDRASAAKVLASSGSSALRVLPVRSREPTRALSRGEPSQARTSASQRSAGGEATQPSNPWVGSHAATPSASLPSASRPAVAATSISSAASVSATCSSEAAALRSRTARPPLRRTFGGRSPQESSSSSTRRTASNAAPAAVRSTRTCSRGLVASGGRSSTGAAVVRPPRTAIPTCPGSSSVAGPRPSACWGTSRPCASASSTGVVASSGAAGTRTRSVVPSPPWSARCTRRARAAGLSSATRAVACSGERPCGVTGRSPLRPERWSPRRASATPLSGRRPCGDSQTSARSTSTSRASRTASGAACTRGTSSLGRGLPQHHQGVEHQQLQPVEVVEGAQHRGPGGGPGGDLGRVVGRRAGQVGADRQQPGKPLVRPAAQLVGQRPGGGPLPFS